jgi:type VI protein secretion system component VasK
MTIDMHKLTTGLLATAIAAFVGAVWSQAREQETKLQEKSERIVRLEANAQNAAQDLAAIKADVRETNQLVRQLVITQSKGIPNEKAIR